MINLIDNRPKKSAYNSFNSAQKLKKGQFRSYRYHNSDIVETSTKVNAGLGSIAGTLVPMILFSKIQKKNMFKLSYGLKEMLIVTAGSIVGGILGGISGDPTKKTNKEKVNEGVFQFMNAAVPGVLVTGMLKYSKKHPSLEKPHVKIIGTTASILLGVIAAAKLSNIICDPKDKVPDRKLTAKDAIANIDDAIGAVVLAKFPLGETLERILPAIYAWCGYRAGQAN